MGGWGSEALLNLSNKRQTPQHKKKEGQLAIGEKTIATPLPRE